MLSRRNWITILLAVGILSIPAVAYGDPFGYIFLPLIIYMFVSPFIIGTFEGAIIARMFKRGYLATIGLMIVANYFSAVLGPFIPPQSMMIIANPMEKGFLLYLFMAFCASIISEYPFCLIALHEKAHTWRPYLKPAVIASILTHIISYAFWMLLFIIIFHGHGV